MTETKKSCHLHRHHWRSAFVTGTVNADQERKSKNLMNK
jgi:hypothetical protein